MIKTIFLLFGFSLKIEGGENIIKEKRGIVLISLLLLVLLSISAVCAEDNETIILGDSESPQPASGNFTELSQLIKESDGTVELDRDYKYVSGDTVPSSGIVIDKPITINGNNYTIDASNRVRIFSVSAENVVINNVNLKNGYYYSSGGALSWSGSDGVFDNSTITNSYSGSSGGAIYWTGSDGLVNNSQFIRNTASYNAGAIYWSGSSGTLNNSRFSENKAKSYDAGAVFWNRGYGSISNTVFDKNYAGNNGGAMYVYDSYVKLSNLTFINNSAYICGGLVMWGNNNELRDSLFVNNTAISVSGGLYLYGAFSVADNITAISNHAVYAGGGVYLTGSENKLINSVLIGNDARFGGGMYIGQSNNVADNVTAISNYADSMGGAVYVDDNSNKLINSVLSNNTARYVGAGIYLRKYYHTMDNLTVTDNYSPSAAGVFIDGSRINLYNSLIANNNARYGGAGIAESGSNNRIDRCVIANNSAGNYGGGLDIEYGTLSNSVVSNNTAIYGGGAYCVNPKFINVTFEDNDAAFGSSIYTINNVTLVDVVLPDEAVFDGVENYVYIVGSNEVEDLLVLNNNYYAYCAEHYNGKSTRGYMDSSMRFIRNILTGEPVGEYLKILIYDLITHKDQLKLLYLNPYIWAFTDEDFRSSNDAIVQRVVNLYDSGFRIGNQNAKKVLANGTVLLYNFSSIVTFNGQQNLFAFQFDQYDTVNGTLIKEAVNKTVLVNQYVEFNITARNVIDLPIVNVFIKDDDYSEGLEYVSWSSNDSRWTYNETTKTWNLPYLEAFNSSTITVKFLAYKNGTFYNNATGGSSNSSVIYSFDVVRVYDANFTVEKIALNETVKLNEQVMFDIIVTNTGEVDLHNITVFEQKFDGLVYNSYVDNKLWNYSLIDSKPVWSLIDGLGIGQSAVLRVIFNTTRNGNFTNVVVVSSNETDNKTTNNTTRVLKPDFDVKKITLTPEVNLGNPVWFDVVVTNTGECNLTDITVVEDKYDGLTYASFIDEGIWTHSIVNAKHTWTLNGHLGLNQSAVLRLVFNADKEGNYTNVVVVSTNETDNKTTNNTTRVLKPNFIVQKVTLTPDVVLGDLVKFHIFVYNNGESDLNDVVVTEDSYEGLLFIRSERDEYWTHSVVNGKNTWTLNGYLAVNATIGFDVVFNTTKEGTFTNYITVSTNETDNKTTENTTRVLKPDFEVQKITLTSEVTLGDFVKFEIVVHNTGECNLTNVMVFEDSYEGLEYHHSEEDEYWTHSVINGKHAWTLNGYLAPEAYIGFDVVFKSTKEGNFTNVVTVSTNETGNKTANNTTRVLKPDFEVQKITLTPEVILGDFVKFEIVVRNTGETDLTDVVIVEDSYEGLAYDHFENNPYWTHSVINGKHAWTLNVNLAPHEVLSLNVVFKSTKEGNYTNVAIVSTNETGNKTANNTTRVLKPDFEVQKISLTPEVNLGGQAVFNIIVHNTGETDLTDIVVVEDSYDGLIYDHFENNGYWIHSVINGKHAWKLNGTLKVREYMGFNVVFNTTREGNFTNVVIVSSNETQNKTTNNTTKVNTPRFNVEKISLTPKVLVGDEVMFEIVVHNTGEIELNDVFIIEQEYEGLEYESFLDNGQWSHSIVDGKNRWVLNRILEPNEYVGLFVFFISSHEGNFTNVVIAGSNETGNKTVNNTTEVRKEDPQNKSNSSDISSLDLIKTAITPKVIVGNQVIFQIVVHNTGNVNLENVTISEDSFEGLTYDHFIDYSRFFTKNDDLSWTMNTLLYPGEYVDFFVVFNTTKEGKFINIVSSGNKTSNDTVEVLKPDFTIEKIALNRNAAIGENVTFEIIVHNTGRVNLNNVTVSEYFFEGLDYVSYMDYLNVWFKNDDLSWTLNATLLPGEYSGFFVTFATTTNGTFTNVVVAKTNETGEKYSNDTVDVFASDFVIEKIALARTIELGEQAIFEIIVHNTGKTALSNITIKEESFGALVYDSFADYLGVWIKNDDLSWTLNATLLPGEYSGFFVTFNSTEIGTFTNVISSGNKTSNDTVKVLKSDYVIEKIAIDSRIHIGDKAVFEIVVHNIGEIELTNITIKEESFDGLIYDSFTDYLNIWTKNDDLSWTMNYTLLPGEYVGFFVGFNTTTNGTFINVISSGNKTANDTVTVLKSDYVIEKTAMHHIVNVGDQAVFEVLIYNTGDVDLNNVTIKEEAFDGLNYVSFVDYLDVWIKNDDLSWTLNATLLPGEHSGFFVVFNTTAAGTFTNIISSGNKTANDTVDVVDNRVANLTVSKLSLAKKVTLGDLAIFEIVVNNNGQIDLNDVFVVEYEYGNGLVYIGYYNGSGEWHHILNNDGKHQFNLANTLKVGESATLFVVFNTTAVGNFTNIVTAGYGNNTIANATNSTEVIDNVVEESEKQVKTVLDKNSTGNPLFAILLVLSTLIILRRRD